MILLVICSFLADEDLPFQIPARNPSCTCQRRFWFDQLQIQQHILLKEIYGPEGDEQFLLVHELLACLRNNSQQQYHSFESEDLGHHHAAHDRGRDHPRFLGGLLLNKSISKTP